MKRFTLLLSTMLLACATNLQAVDFTLSSAGDVTKGDVTVSFAKGSGSTAPTWYSAGLRLYAKNTITISATTDIDSISFNWEKQGNKAFASVTANCGTYTHPTAAGKGVWKKDAANPTKSVTFTFTLGNSGQLQLNTFSVAIQASADPAIDASDIDFGKVLEAGAIKELEVVGTNLTEAITYTPSEDAAFTVAGTLTAEGGTLTITFNGTIAQDYTATLTLASGTTTKVVNLSATLISTIGKGTKEDPFTVADVMALNNMLGKSQKYWVIGYIVGAIDGTSLDKFVTSTTTVVANIAIAATDTDFGENFIPVALPNNSAARSALNIANNPTNVGKQVKVCGTLEPYFSTTSVKSVETTEEYELISNPTSINNNTLNAQTLKTIENGQLVIIRDSVKYNAMGVRLQ